MSYSILTGGSKEEASRGVIKLCDSNSSPEMPALKSFLLDIINAVDGDDKRIHIDANGWHSGGNVSHTITVKSSTLVPE